MHAKRILVLAGTHEARLLANRLVKDGYDVISSFAGVTAHPLLPQGEIRTGGFGGADGLRKYVAEAHIDFVVDATHPFAAIISRHAAQAVPRLLRLERRAWVAQEGDNWINVPDIGAAVAALPFEARVLLTIGRKEIAPFMSRPDLSGVGRMIEPPDNKLPATWRLVLQRPPFDLDDELILLREARISHVASKNAGGSETAAKLEAARLCHIPVVMIARPFKPDVETFSSVNTIAAAIACR